METKAGRQYVLRVRGAADGYALVPGTRWDEDVGEASLSADASVQDRVLRHAPNYAQVSVARSLLKPLKEAERRLLEVVQRVGRTHRLREAPEQRRLRLVATVDGRVQGERGL